MNAALEEFVRHWQPRQRQSFGMIAALAVRLQNLVNNHGDWSVYDLPSIALAALYLVVEPSRLVGGWTRDQLIDELLPLAQRAGTGRPDAEHREVVTAVVDLMHGRSTGGQAFIDFYGDWTGENYQRLQKPLEYLYLVGGEDTVPTVKADARAVNMFQGLYTLDLEDQNAADNFIADRQLARGDVDEVVATVRRQHMTLQALVDRIRDQIKQIRRDVRSVDYVQQVQPTMERIMQVLGEQLKTTSDFKHRVQQRLEPGQPGEHQMRETEALLERRYYDLSDVLNEVSQVNQVFAEEQDRQVWTRYRGNLHDPEKTLFAPLIGMKVGALEALLEPVCALALGVRKPRVPSALELVERTAPKVRRVTPARVDNPFEIDDIVVPVPWIPEVTLSCLRELFGAVDRPTRLSELLTRAVRDHPDLCQTREHATLTHLACLIALTAFAPPQATEAADDRTIAVLAAQREFLDPDHIRVINDNTPFNLPGIAGDDLLLQPVSAALGGDQ